MKIKIISVPLTVFLFSLLALNSIEANAQTYLPVGPKTNVPVATVEAGGWTECYRDLYNNDMVASTVLSDCPGSRLMLSCRDTGSSTLTLLAQGNRSDVTFDTGSGPDLHEANGVDWYFSSAFGSWGFVRAGDFVGKSPCDTLIIGINNERLCWHVDMDNGGWRCGATQMLNNSTSFERIVYMPTPTVVTPIPTISEWGLIAMVAVLGLVGFMVIRRRKAGA